MQIVWAKRVAPYFLLFLINTPSVMPLLTHFLPADVQATSKWAMLWPKLTTLERLPPQPSLNQRSELGLPNCFV